MSTHAHILVVDDDKRLRDLIARYLGEQGFRVTVATDAADARAKLKSISFDLLVLDIMMPGESGLDLTRSLRQESNVPILLLTAMGEVQDRIHGLETGADDYLGKPFEPKELILRINSILKRAQPRVAPLPAAAGTVKFGAFAFELERRRIAGPCRWRGGRRSFRRRGREQCGRGRCLASDRRADDSATP
jgi:two-component system phosphate regulon response regulator OmpR